MDQMDATLLELGQDMDRNILNIKLASEWLWFCAINIIYATSEAEFMKKLHNAEAELKKALLVKKHVIQPLLRKNNSQRKQQSKRSSKWRQTGKIYIKPNLQTI